MPQEWPDYELLDFGRGRKLERFGPWVLDRPCPGVTAKPQAANWDQATGRYDGKRWSPPANGWAGCRIQVAELGFTLGVEPLPSGQVGVFPEQFWNWRWITRQVARADPPLKVLNLFAYTGGSTLAAARVGAEVTHVDAAKSIVGRAGENATASGLAGAPIRWVVEDAVKFCRREVKRGNQYDAVILDPPSYGHGPKGEEWVINRDLLPLLHLCRKLTSSRREFLLCTCHTPGIGPAELAAYVSDGLFGHCGQPPDCGTLFLQTADGRKLPSGVFARWPA
jgi:23S rRNA (cytosine1962-C5)-methyltransferase